MLPRFLLIKIAWRVVAVFIQIWALAAWLSGGGATSAYGADVDLQTARLVAQNQLVHHLTVFGHWNGSHNPTIAYSEPVYFKADNDPVAYHFNVNPSGYILVCLDDGIHPIPFYSTRATFIPNSVNQPNAIESWIVTEIHGKMRALESYRSRAVALRRSAESGSVNPRTQAAWLYLAKRGLRIRGSLDIPGVAMDPAVKGQSLSGSDVLAPLLSSAWGQGRPYNAKLPDDDCSGGYTLTGCVATAWAQVLRYYQWPDRGVGEKTYSWNGSEITADFSQSKAYDWDNMPDVLTAFSPQAQVEAVGWLMFFTAAAAETDFSCTYSNSAVWASDVFARYFKYKPTIAFHSRFSEDSSFRPISANYSAEAWFNLIKAELDQGRLVIFSIFSDISGHEVVVDGYDDSMDAVHINFGWDGNSDGYYNISDDTDFNASGYDWYTDRQQYIVTGIEPDRASASSSATSGGGGGGCFIACLGFF